MAAIVTQLGWCRTLIALLLPKQLVSVQAPYSRNVPVAAIPTNSTFFPFLNFYKQVTPFLLTLVKLYFIIVD